MRGRILFFLMGSGGLILVALRLTPGPHSTPRVSPPHDVSEGKAVAELLRTNGTKHTASTGRKRPVTDGEMGFGDFTANTLRSLPRLSSLREKGRDFHLPPPELMDSNEAFAEIAEKMRRDPRLIPEGLEFYRACAASDSLTAIRAVCLRHLKDAIHRTKSAFPLDDSQFSEIVKRVADELPRE